MAQANKGLAQSPRDPRVQQPSTSVAEYDAFFDATYPFLLRVALAAGASVEEAEDAVDETMADLYHRWGEIAKPRSYARKAVLNAIARTKKRDGERFARTVAGGHLTPEGSDGTAMAAWEDRQWVVQRLNALPPAQREVMACVVDDMSTAEIASALGKTEATVRKNLQWARERLKLELLNEQDHGHQCVPDARRETR